MATIPEKLAAAVKHHRAGELQAAEKGYRRAIELKPDFVRAHNNVGAVLAKQGRFCAAEPALLRAVELAPNHAEVHRNLVNLDGEQGNRKTAVTHFQRALEINPAYISAREGTAQIKRHSEADQNETSRLEEALSGKTLPRKDARSAHFALGKMYDDIGQWDNAFEHCRNANRLADRHFNRESVVGYSDALIDAFDAALFSAQAKLGRLLDFCGLEWDPNCLEFHTNKRVVSTASYWQVRQPIYTGSVDRWRHYEKHLGPLKEALQWAP